MKKIRRAVSFAGTSKKSQLKECGIKSASPEGGYYPTKSGYKSVANMPANRRRSQPDILESSDKIKSFYSANYSSNYCAIYSSHATTESIESEASRYFGSKNYALVPRMGRRASKDLNAKYYKRENSQSDNKKDYQDIYKDRKTTTKTSAQTEQPRRISIDTGAIITTVPSVPSRKYNRDEDYASFEELAEDTAPPPIAPVSGILNQNAGKAVVRPIAFKPVVTNKMSSSSSYSNHSPDYAYEKPHVDDGYSSQESRACSHNGTMRDSYIYEARPGSYDSNHCREQKSGDCYQMTPSPTDNSAHYEQMLQEKERELTTVRETMEDNERVIFQVNEEKRLNWESQMKELTAEYHRRLRLQQDRAHKCEQDLHDQINRLQKDNQRVMKERDQYSLQKEHSSAMQEQLKSFRQKNEELSNRLASVSCDCELLRQQDQDKHKQIQTLEELVTVIKAENMNLSNELDEKRRLVKKIEREQDKAAPTDDRELEKLKKQLSDRDIALQAEREQYVRERELWEQEKKKVLQYQRQLQSNYIQMCRRNSDLEAHFPKSRSQNNNNPAEKQLPNLKSQEKCNFKAQLESTPESLC